ncbi:hypothetical protein Psesu_0646 [Pseudoxanthomonas suwonensis 11-1]|uniref:Uncharacterized protein n=1 Tax=Pseudoxanthomonas suwonensis (strain 11-1) TaxID=743721 RepID=E6WQQ4_PSEUU|nr:hypothetical protein Psesu_0646 [Pseudoxanthomonas suwonensis 11-1]
MVFLDPLCHKGFRVPARGRSCIPDAVFLPADSDFCTNPVHFTQPPKP